MTEPVNLRCGACGHTAPPQDFPEAATIWHVLFYARAGIHRDIIVADTPNNALQIAMQRSESRTFKPDFEPDDTAYSIQKIAIEDQAGEQHAIWSDPDDFAELNADAILELLEGMIAVADELSTEAHALDSRISDIVCCGEESERELQNIRKKGGAQ